MITKIGMVEIITVPDCMHSAGIDAIVREQDAALLLDMKPVITEPEESYTTMITAMEVQPSLEPGTVLVNDARPRIFTAITCDVEQEPVCREEWITACLLRIFTECLNFRIYILAMPLLGVAHGRISRQTSRTILENLLKDSIIQYPQKILIYETGTL